MQVFLQPEQKGDMARTVQYTASTRIAAHLPLLFVPLFRSLFLFFSGAAPLPSFANNFIMPLINT